MARHEASLGVGRKLVCGHDANVEALVLVDGRSIEVAHGVVAPILQNLLSVDDLRRRRTLRHRRATLRSNLPFSNLPFSNLPFSADGPAEVGDLLNRIEH